MDYSEYKFSKKEWFIYIGEYLLAAGSIAGLFYDSYIAFLIFLPGVYLFLKMVKAKLKEKRTEGLKTEFIQAISFMGASLYAGLSIENSLKEASEEMGRLYETDSLMKNELATMINQINLGVRIEELMDDFAKRSQVSEIKDFATVFKIARKGGGRYTDVINNCIDLINSNQEMEKDIRIMISGKRFEQKVMNAIPFVLIAVLKVASADLIGVLYHNAAGVIVMTICLGIYAGAIILSERIANIKV